MHDLRILTVNGFNYEVFESDDDLHEFIRTHEIPGDWSVEKWVTYSKELDSEVKESKKKKQAQ